MKDGYSIWSALVPAAGIALAGWSAGRGFVQARAADRFVTVKGVSEREARADIALWPLRFVSTDDDLGKAQAKIRQSHANVLAFLQRHGLDPAAAEVHKLEVTDVLANPPRPCG